MMNAHKKRMIRKLISPFRSLGLKNKTFSIISNNCWGGYVYDIYGLKYLSPTIGLYFFPNEYIKFINNLKHYLSLDAKVLDYKDSKYQEELKKDNNFMLGSIGDIEVVFVHYESAEKAVEKWNRRRKRVDFANLLVKFNDQNNCKEEHFKAFTNADFKNKLFFTANKDWAKESNHIFIKKFENEGYVLDDIKTSSKVVNIKKILNSMK